MAEHNYRAHFRCFRGCPGEWSVYDVIYTCPMCGGLLEVVHDLEALQTRSAEDWEALIDSRVGATTWPYGSGVWGKKEWVIPSLDDDNVVSMYEGNTNLFWAERLGKQMDLPDLWVKLCGNSHTGSFKDLGMTVLVSVVKQMMEMGKPVRAVACASTGDTSAALAAYAAAAGIPAIIFLPQGKVSPAQLIQPIANGAHVLALDTDFDGCMRIVKEVTQDNTIYLANSMNSLRIEGQKTVGIEIVQQFDWEVPDWIIIPVGNLGNISALYKGLKLLVDLGITHRMPRLVAAQAEKANPFYRSYRQDFGDKVVMESQETLASAIRIGDPVSYEKAVQAVQETGGLVEQATEHEMANAAAMADLTGMYTCPHTGTALSVLFKLRGQDVIRREDKVVVISTAHGLKFTPFKVGYHEGTLPEVESDLANPPVYLPADAGIVQDTIQRKLGELVTVLDYHATSFSQGRMDFAWEELSEEERTQLYADWEAGKGLIGGHPRYRPGYDRLPDWGLDRVFFRTFALDDERGGNGDGLRSALASDRVLEIEIGFGRGDFILDRAERYPERVFLAYEVKSKAARLALGRAERLALENLWISDDDVRVSLPEIVPDGRVCAVHVLFPDPWWKEQHKVKRLFSPPFVDLLARKIQPHGILNLKSDVEGYNALVRYLVGNHQAFGHHDPDLEEKVGASAPTHREQWCYDHGLPVWTSYFQREGN